jgi:signal transduction histidine kinase
MDGQVLLWINVAGCLAGGFVGIAFAVIAWRNRDVPAALPYGALTLSVSAWGFLYAALLLTNGVTLGTWVSQLIRAVTAFVPVLWFRFAAVYTGNDQLRTRPIMAVLWTITIGYVVLNLTAPFHGMMAHRVVFETVAGLTAPVDPQGPLFWAFIVYAYTMISVGFGLLLRFLLRSRNIYRKQTAAIIAGSTLPLVGNVVVLLELVPHPALDVTPMLFAANGLVIGWALFQYDFLEVTPVATDRLVDDLPDPVLVIDESETLVEYNAAADSVFATESLGGISLKQLPLPAAAELTRTQDVTLETDGGERVYTPQVSPIEDQHGQQRGRLIVLRDVTVERRRFDRIQALQSTTQRFLAATSQAEIANVAAEFFETDLGLPVVWYRGTDQELVPTSRIGSESESDDLSPFERNSSLWDHFEADETVVVDPAAVGLDGVVGDTPERVLLVPVDGNGLFCLGLDPADDTEEYRQIATILRGTMTAALARVEREAQLRESRREVDQRTEQIEFFSGVLRHNIRNGMQVIQSQTELLGDQVEDGSERLAAIERWADELIDLTREVRRITDVVTAPEGERRRPVDLGSVLSERLDTIETDLDVVLSRSIDTDVTVYANDLLGNVLDSVLHNAVEHTDSDRPRIDVSIREKNGSVEVRIVDQGPGISDELRESVFEREVATRQTGHGFGLYFVSVMMDLYEGDVWFEHNEPRGTVAVLQFQPVDGT